ncbi:MAG: hypothetical protein EAZ44_02215 [Cytophagia bacterium]|nr:MAG: hypothetical protein EAY69_04935 [Cytophagales bacterium]TAG06494.1 MAG: hypothetical protein EAZ44_02215 [Cytophagia bacterium]TAG44264.1 MAG: hypothetical protein EAZ31_02645 [Cytophagia bacterium]TAH30956.1 MAG: hypothetical protein EAZ06_01210 [Cytophagales bacterium]
MAKLLKEIQMELTNSMIKHYVESVGLSAEDTYNEYRNSWSWKRGTATIEVFVESVEVGDIKSKDNKITGKKTREYLRIFSLVGYIPQISQAERAIFFLHLLNINDKSLGVKLTVMEETDKIYATYERDINGIDYNELVTCIKDLEWWADRLDDELKIYGKN